MLTPNLVLFYVANAPKSAAFYANLLGAQPIEASDAFAMFKLPSGMMLGLWDKQAVEPTASWQGAAAELCFAVADQAAVEMQFAALQAQGLEIVQPITQMDFGLTFVALDADGHRLRVYFPS